MNSYEYDSHYKILPAIHNWSSDPSRIDGGVKVKEGFTYTSANNSEWMPVEALRSRIDSHRSKIDAI